MQATATIRRPLEGERFQVIVIGGGINGVAIARECARRGRRTLLIEQHDFGSGTTSRSTRIIHGGLRYLEHGDIGLVRESLRERERLLRDKPHLVKPIQFLLALNGSGRRSALAIRSGLLLYRIFGGSHRLANAHDERRKLERLLDSGRHWSMFNFEDAQCEFPERLVAEWLVDAVEAGAEVRNHTQVLAIDVSNGHAKGILLRDLISRKEEHVEANWIVNATGPWADRVCHRARIQTSQPMIGGIRGSHIVLPRFAGAPDAAVYTEALDGRPVFVIPWNDQILVGSTEVADSTDPGKVCPSADEIDYLLASVKRLFPRAMVTQAAIRYAFAGVRPLPFTANSTPAAVSRKHYFHDHKHDGAAQMISIVGGKLTTAASLARECADLVGAARRKHGAVTNFVDQDVEALVDRCAIEIAQRASLSEAAGRALLEWHGRDADRIAALASASPNLKAPLCSHNEHITAEAVYAIHNESAVTLADVLLRRVPVAYGACWSEACSREAAIRVGAAIGWDEQRIGAELENFECERAALLLKAVSSRTLLEAAAD